MPHLLPKFSTAPKIRIVLEREGIAGLWYEYQLNPYIIFKTELFLDESNVEKAELHFKYAMQNKNFPMDSDYTVKIKFPEIF